MVDSLPEQERISLRFPLPVAFFITLLCIQDEASEPSDGLLTADISFIFSTLSFHFCVSVCRYPQLTRQSDRSLELKSQAVGSHLVGARNWTQVLCESNQWP